MPKFTLTTHIRTRAEVCFDLARSIDLHIETMSHTREKAVGGITEGLIGLNDTVTWKARHFGVVMTLTSKITDYSYPSIFVDQMVSGPFKTLKHKHLFEQKDGYTVMTDTFIYESPLGILGRLADTVFLNKYMQKLIKQRNLFIKQKAEQDYE